MGQRKSDDVVVGEDSFLDTTANLVGILIILVVIIGTKTKIDAEEYGRSQAAAEQSLALGDAEHKANALVESLQKQKLKLLEYEFEAQYRKEERDRLMAEVVQARESVERDLSELDHYKREQLEQDAEIQKLQSELADVEQQMGAAESSERPKVILEHLPTPMARTVFTKEMHIQLKDHSVTLIPWDRLVETLKSQVPLALRRNASRTEIEDSIGPIGGFVMHYRMQAVPNGFELEKFELEPTPSAASEPMEIALSSSGRLQLELASRDPRETVVTVWVYPDSFAEFRTLKAALFESGFLSAARPLPEDTRIGASPRGSRSSAQ